MATLAQLETALRNADAAGDADAARTFAAEIGRLRQAPKQETFDPTTGMSTAEKVLAGAGHALNNLYLGGKQMFGNVARYGARVPMDQSRTQQEIDENKRLAKPLMDTTAGKIGDVLGNVAAAAPTALIPGVNTYTGAALTGAALGALQPTSEGESRLMNAGIGAAGGAAGQGIANGIGRLVQPVKPNITPEMAGLVQKADQYGIPLTAGQATGSRPLRVAESVMESLPMTAGPQAAIKDAQRQAFNRAALQTVGEQSDRATPEVLNAARNRIGGVFNDVSGRNAVRLGDDFLRDLVEIDTKNRAMGGFANPGVSGLVDKSLDLLQRGSIGGESYQTIRSGLGRQAKDAFSSGRSAEGQAIKDIQRALDAAADRSIAPADREAWRQANQQWQALKVLETAAAPNSADAVLGNVSPAKLAQALMTADKKGFTYGTGKQEQLSDLARIGQALVKEQIPNSGTAERSFYRDLLTNPISTVVSGSAGLTARPAQKVLNSDLVQAYLKGGLSPSDPRVLALAKALRESAALTGAGAAPQLIQQE